MDETVMVQRVSNGFIVTPYSPNSRCSAVPDDICVAENTEGLLAVMQGWANRSDEPLKRRAAGSVKEAGATDEG